MIPEHALVAKKANGFQCKSAVVPSVCASSFHCRRGGANRTSGFGNRELGTISLCICWSTEVYRTQDKILLETFREKLLHLRLPYRSLSSFNSIPLVGHQAVSFHAQYKTYVS